MSKYTPADWPTAKVEGWSSDPFDSQQLDDPVFIENQIMEYNTEQSATFRDDAMSDKRKPLDGSFQYFQGGCDSPGNKILTACEVNEYFGQCLKCSISERCWNTINEMHKLISSFYSDYDCDNDGHKYGTGCRKCDAKQFLDKFRLEL